MFTFLRLLSLIFAGKEIVEQALEKPVKQPIYFDEDAYHEDIRNGMDCMTALRKRQAGGYDTTNPKYAYDALNDVERYERDKKKYGEEFAEKNRKSGNYRFIMK